MLVDAHQSYSFSFSDPVVQAGLLAAQAALSAASADPLLFVTTQTGSFTTPGGSVTNFFVTQQTTTDYFGIINTIGPASILIGELGNCAGIQAVPVGSTNFRPLGCSGGTPFEVAAGNINIDAATSHQTEYLRNVQTTNVLDVFETWQVLGLAQTVAVPVPGTLFLCLVGLGLLSWRQRALIPHGPSSRGSEGATHRRQYGRHDG